MKIPKEKEQIRKPNRTDNTMAKKKTITGQTIQWLKKRQ
jgi:hypothetical protein